MCRLFGVISRDPVAASFYLKDAPQSLLFQSQADKKRHQGDGWGVGWYESGHPRIFKSPKPLYQDPAGLRRAIQQPTGNVLVGHVRWASNPLKLPRQELIGRAHTQPFMHDPWLFVHNGTLYIPREVKAELGPWERFVEGKNDSEVLFYWLMKTVVHGAGKDWPAKLRASLRGLDRIWATCKARYPLYKYPYHGLNWILTNGRRLIAFSYVNPGGFDQGKALCGAGQPYYQMQIQEGDRELIVASEPLTPGSPWRPLGHGQLLVAEKPANPSDRRGLLVDTLEVMACS